MLLSSPRKIKIFLLFRKFELLIITQMPPFFASKATRGRAPHILALPGFSFLSLCSIIIPAFTNSFLVAQGMKV
jgi:hypothetical protein